MGKGRRQIYPGDEFIAIPIAVHFDRYSQMTKGLDAVMSEAPFIVSRNGIAAVTGWLAGEFWATCYDSITTSWAACYSAPSTSWTATYSPVTTVWTVT